MMDMTQMTKSMFAYQKAALNSSLSMVSMAQDQSERMMNMVLDNSPFVPPQGKEFCRKWFQMCKEMRSNTQKAIDTSFQNMESYWTEAMKSTTS